MVSRRILTYLVAGLLVLPIVIVVLVGLARLLNAMQDQAGASVLDRVAMAGGIVWAINLVCLIAAQGLNALGPPPRPPDIPPE